MYSETLFNLYIVSNKDAGRGGGTLWGKEEFLKSKLKVGMKWSDTLKMLERVRFNFCF